MEEHESHEIKSWKPIYLLIVFVLALQIFLYNAITNFFR